VTAIELPLAGATVRFTARAGGVSDGPYRSLNLGLWTDDDPAAVAENRRRAADDRHVAYGRQVHGAHVLCAEAATAEPVQADGQATTVPGLVALVVTADCLPIALAGDGGVAMLHAGWRGLVEGVVEEGVRVLRRLGVAGRLEAAIGPGAGACCYEVGTDVASRFPAWARSGRTLDLKAAATDRLRQAGVASVIDVGRCTMCEPDTFFSHRRSGGMTGRQGGLIWRV
jgi:YfiH family protein